MITTERLLLRRWRPADLDPFAALNSDPEVMAEFPNPLDRAASDALAAHAQRLLATHGWGPWAVELRTQARFIGLVGLAPVTFDAPFTPAVEIAWRLSREAWGHGYATEAARAALSFAFDQLQLPRVVSFTSTTNLRSQAVMQRLGMTRTPGWDFDHPRVPDGHRLRRHVVWVAVGG